MLTRVMGGEYLSFTGHFTSSIASNSVFLVFGKLEFLKNQVKYQCIFWLYSINF